MGGGSSDPLRSGPECLYLLHARRDGTLQKVRYNNPKPANFEEAEKVVVQGKNQGDVFVADNILVKCPSKYNDARGLKQKASSSSSGASSSPVPSQ